jgi:hypothetical protein
MEINSSLPQFAIAWEVLQEKEIKHTNFYRVGSIMPENICPACHKSGLPVFDTDALKNNEVAQKPGCIYLFTIEKVSTNYKRIVYVGQTGRQLFKRMDNYTKGASGKWDNLDCICTLSLEAEYNHENPYAYFKEIQKRINGKFVGNKGTTNRRLAYLYFKVLSNPDYHGEVWAYPLPHLENLLIKNLNSPLLNQNSPKFTI